MRPVVCVVDDDQRVRDAVCVVLEGAGFVAVQASDGDLGLKLVREARPAVVVMDIVMPNKEGIETIQEIRDEFPDLPILAMSGAHAPGREYLDWALAVGADECLAKPIDPIELIHKVTQLEGRAARRSKRGS